MSRRCRVPATTLIARVLDTGEVPAPLAGHVARCLRCQVRVTRARRSRHLLGRMPIGGLEMEAPERSRRARAWVATLLSGVAVLLVTRGLRAAVGASAQSR